MSSFIPAVTLDYKNATPKSLVTALEEISLFAKTAPKMPLNLEDGRHTINQEKAEQLLLRCRLSRRMHMVICGERMRIK